MESTSVSSSMQGSISSGTSSLNRYSSNVKEETLQNKPLKKLNSKKFASFGSFMSFRRRAQSKLSQSSVKLPDDGSIALPDPSSVEASDESSNYVQVLLILSKSRTCFDFLSQTLDKQIPMKI